MVDKNFCLSSYMAFRYIWKDGVDFCEGFQHKIFTPLSDVERIPVKTSEDINKEIQSQFDVLYEKYENIGILLSGGMDSANLAAYLRPGSHAYTFNSVSGVFDADVAQAKKYKLGSSYKSGITLKSKIAWLFYESLRLFPGQRYWANRSKRLFSKIPYNCSDKVLFGWRRLPSLTNHYQCVFNIKDFSSFIELPFEDTIMRVPVGYDNYLKEDFGDYMSLPPVEERVSLHSAEVVDLHNSYECYHYNPDKCIFELI